jgi:hypothetical protein
MCKKDSCEQEMPTVVMLVEASCGAFQDYHAIRQWQNMSKSGMGY